MSPREVYNWVPSKSNSWSNNKSLILKHCSLIDSNSNFLSHPKLTICSLDEDVSKLLKIVSESDVVPFHNVWIDTLESFLIKTIEKGREYIIEEGKKSRKWMEKHWHPKDITNEFIDIYKNIYLPVLATARACGARCMPR